MGLFSIDHHHYFHGAGNEGDFFAQILQKLNLVISNQNTIMATSQERHDALMERLNVITNDIAADYQKLLDEARNNAVSQESLDRAEANIMRLEAIGASVANPLPPGEEIPN